MERQELLKYLAGIILNLEKPHPVRVSIDGVDGSGKTFLVNELADILRLSDRQIITASIDGFHNNSEVRYQKGRNSPEGFYLDSYNHESIITNLLKPLGPNGNLLYKQAVFDSETNSEVLSPLSLSYKKAILLMDGIFLQRPELVNYWDLKIFLDVDFELTIKRMLEREQNRKYFESEERYLKMFNERYMSGQKLYLKEVKPKETADIVIDNNDLKNPEIIKSGVPLP